MEKEENEVDSQNEKFKPYIPADKVMPEFTPMSVILGVILAVVFACDEVAEMLDKTGLTTKERKELVSQIEGKLSTIARQGRAFGIHFILATQRPDATIIPGQIKNNIDFRVCGRADNVLSQIILDSTAAADQIPKDARGRFITRDGTVFQAFLFDEGEL